LNIDFFLDFEHFIENFFRDSRFF